MGQHHHQKHMGNGQQHHLDRSQSRDDVMKKPTSSLYTGPGRGEADFMSLPFSPHFISSLRIAALGMRISSTFLHAPVKLPRIPVKKRQGRRIVGLHSSKRGYLRPNYRSAHLTHLVSDFISSRGVFGASLFGSLPRTVSPLEGVDGGLGRRRRMFSLSPEGRTVEEAVGRQGTCCCRGHTVGTNLFLGSNPTEYNKEIQPTETNTQLISGICIWAKNPTNR